MNDAHIDLSQVAAMDVGQLQAAAAPLLAALKEKKAQASKAARRERRKAYDRERRRSAVAVNLRVGDAADAKAARALIAALKARAKAHDTSFAHEAAMAEAHLTASIVVLAAKPSAAQTAQSSRDEVGGAAA